MADKPPSAPRNSRAIHNKTTLKEAQTANNFGRVDEPSRKRGLLLARTGGKYEQQFFLLLTRTYYVITQIIFSVLN